MTDIIEENQIHLRWPETVHSPAKTLSVFPRNGEGLVIRVAMMPTCISMHLMQGQATELHAWLGRCLLDPVEPPMFA